MDPETGPARPASSFQHREKRSVRVATGTSHGPWSVVRSHYRPPSIQKPVLRGRFHRFSTVKSARMLATVNCSTGRFAQASWPTESIGRIRRQGQVPFGTGLPLAAWPGRWCVTKPNLDVRA
jgi:hypothetical protein